METIKNKQKKVLKSLAIVLTILGLILISGCSSNSSYRDCNIDCENVNKNVYCSEVTSFGFCLNNSEHSKLGEYCYNECRGLK